LTILQKLIVKINFSIRVRLQSISEYNRSLVQAVAYDASRYIGNGPRNESSTGSSISNPASSNWVL